MARLKTSYINSLNKKAVREFLLKNFKFKKVIGLAGPDINNYIDYLMSLGYTDFEIFEKDPNILIKQLTTLNKNVKISLRYDDIIQADASKNNILFDLDFCCTLRSVADHIRKFKDNFILTVSSRMGIKETINAFFLLRNENILSQEDINIPLKHTLFTTEKGNYLFIRYHDTAGMCCFAKIT